MPLSGATLCAGSVCSAAGSVTTLEASSAPRDSTLTEVAASAPGIRLSQAQFFLDWGLIHFPSVRNILFIVSHLKTSFVVK